MDASSSKVTEPVADGMVEPSGPPVAAIVQLLRSRQREDSRGPYLEVGRLAVRWYKHEVGTQLHQLLTDQSRLVWSAPTASTKPAHVADENGKRWNGYRIGDAAKDMIRPQGMRSGLPGLLRLELQ